VNHKYIFPLSEDKEVEWCTVEGVAWKKDGSLVIVTDKAGKDFPEACQEHAISVGIFKLA